MNALAVEKQRKAAEELQRFDTECKVRYHFQQALNYEYEKDIFNTLLSWNKVLCKDVYGNYTSQAYNNRSLLYQSVQLYKECKFNIMMAGDDRKLAVVLKARQEIVTKASKRNGKNFGLKKQQDFLKLSHKANPRLPFLIDAIRYMKKTSHCKELQLLTTKTLEVGDVIAMEPPFFTVALSDEEKPKDNQTIEKDTNYQRCYHCHQDNFLNLTTCPDCATVMYCSDKCQKESSDKYHKYECFLKNKMYGRKPDNQDLIRYMRTLFLSMNLFDHYVLDLKEFINSRKNTKKTVFDYDLSDMNSRESQRNLLLCFDSLDYNDTAADRNDHIGMVVRAHPSLGDEWKKYHHFITKFIRRHSDITDRHVQGLFKWPGNASKLMNEMGSQRKKDYSTIRKKVGGGAYPFMSMIKHSCVPNLMRHYSKDNKVNLIVTRRINPGEEISISFHDSLFFSRFPKSQRIEMLRSKFSFECKCEACMGLNFPVFNEQKVKDKSLLKIAVKFDMNLHKFNHKQLIKKFRYLMKLLKKHHQMFPSVELSIIQSKAATILEHTARPQHSFHLF